MISNYSHYWQLFRTIGPHEWAKLMPVLEEILVQAKAQGKVEEFTPGRRRSIGPQFRRDPRLRPPVLRVPALRSAAAMLHDAASEH